MVNVNIDKKVAKKPFLLSRGGRITFIITVFAIHFFFLSLADHTPPFLGRGPEGNPAPDGIYLSPAESPDFAFRPSVFMFILITATVVSFSDVITNRINEISIVSDIISKIEKSEISVLPIIAAVIYTILLIVGILFWPNIGIEGRTVLNQPRAVKIGMLFQTFMIFSVAHFYYKPIFPREFPESIDQDWGIYIQNQWRFAQVLLTTVLSVFLGTAIPFAADSGTFGISATISLIGLLITGPVAIILFIAVRLHNMERIIRYNS